MEKTLALFACLGCLAGPALAEAPAFAVAERGKGAVPIRLVTPDAPSAKYAAEELRDYVRKLTGETMAIATENADVRAVAVAVDDALGIDEFRISCDGNALRIAGGKRGILYGVYDVLERFGDVGWYASWHEVVPKADRFAVPADVRIEEKPAFELRDPMWYDTFGDGILASRYRLNGGWNGTSPAKFGGYSHRFGAKLYSCHTLMSLLPPSEYSDGHPEYYAERNGVRRRGGSDGQLCLTNPDVLRIVTSNLLARIAGDPTAKFYGVSQMDNMNYCTCPKCAAVDEDEGSHAGTTVRFINAVADAVAAKYPDKIIETLAYQYTRKPPKTRLRPNVMPCLCTIECDFAEPLATGKYKENVSFREDIRGWARQTDRLYVWDYTVNFAHYLHAFPNVQVLQDNLRFFRDNGVRYIYEQGDYHGIHAWFGELKAYLIAKWMWNPDLSAEPLMDRFFRGYYGKAAPLVRKHYDEVESRQRARSASGGKPLLLYETIPESVCDLEFLERSLKLWREAEKLVAGEDPVYGYNARMGALSVAYSLFMRGYKAAWATRNPERFRGNVDSAKLAKWILERFDESKKRIGVKDDNSMKSAEQFVRLLKAEVAGGGSRGASDSAEVAQEHFQVDHGRRTDDPTAIGGKAVKMETYHYDWSVYCKMKDIAYDDADYVVSVHMRIDRREGGSDGEAFWAGVRDSGAKKDCGMIAKKASECPDGWAWYDVATVRPNDEMSLWIGPGRYDLKAHRGNPAVTAVYCDRVSIRRAGAPKPVAALPRATPLDRANRLLIGGSLGWGPRTDAEIKEFKECGFDIAGIVPQGDRATLDRCASNGVAVTISGVLPWWSYGRNCAGKMCEENPISKYDEAAAKFVDHPAITGIYTGDEPSALDFEHYGKVIRHTQAHYPQLLPMLNLFPNYASAASNSRSAAESQLGTKDYRSYLEAYCKHIPLDYICFDCYCWSGHLTPAALVENLREVADVAIANRKELWAYLQANREQEIHKTWRLVNRSMTADTMRWQANLSLSFGARSIRWACYRKGWWTENAIDTNGCRTATWYNLKTVNGELHRTGERYMRFRTVGTELVGPGAKVWEGVRQQAVPAANGAAIRDLAATDGAALAVGHMVSRDGAGDHAVYVTACDDPDGYRIQEHVVKFSTDRPVVSAWNEAGEAPVERLSEKTYAVRLKTSRGILIVAGGGK